MRSPISTLDAHPPLTIEMTPAPLGRAGRVDVERQGEAILVTVHHIPGDRRWACLGGAREERGKYDERTHVVSHSRITAAAEPPRSLLVAGLRESPILV